MRRTDRLWLATRIALLYAQARWLMATTTLPAAVVALGHPARSTSTDLTTEQLARGVDKVLRIGRRRLRCLPRALVLYSLLVEIGHDPKLVVGVLEPSPSPIAHAWVEIDGLDVGPPPGRGAHTAMATYPLPVKG